MIDFTKPVQTRDGKPVRILCTDMNNPVYPVVGLVNYGREEYVITWTIEGQMLDGSTNFSDLIQVEEKPTPRRHAELIKRWAENDKMRIKYGNSATNQWVETANPLWLTDTEYEEILPGDPLF